MPIQTKDVFRKKTELKSNAKNSRSHPKAQIDAIRKSILEFGFVGRIAIDEDNNILAGHGRVLACPDSLDIPCVIVSGLTEAQKIKFMLADNGTFELGSTDSDSLAALFAEMPEVFSELSEMGLKFEKEIQKQLNALSSNDDMNDFSENAEKICQAGDIWQLGPHRIMCGDSTLPQDVARLMGGKKCNMVFTDPPWNVNIGSRDRNNGQEHKKRQILNDHMSTQDFKQFLSQSLQNIKNFSDPGTPTYIVMSAQEWGTMMLALSEHGFHWSSTIIWNKNSLSLSRKDYHMKHEPIWYGWTEGAARTRIVKDRTMPDVWDFDKPNKSDLHPTMKPVALVERAIVNSSYKNDIILDLFLGSGTTLMASEASNRICYAMELDPNYCDVAIQRWSEHTNQKPTLLERI